MKTNRTAAPARLLPSVLGQAGHVQQLKQMDRLMKVMVTVTDQGFVPCGFRSNLLEGPVLLVEPPEDQIVEDLTARGVGLAGRFDGRHPALMWCAIDGVRVEWEIAREWPVVGAGDRSDLARVFGGPTGER